VLAVAGRTSEVVVVAPWGERWTRAGAINRALVEVGGFWGLVGRLYRVPPLGWMEERVYSWVARHRGWLARFWGDPPEI
jgi:predicted DCC family thiol-disulfide oxidoreductase YuxK